MCNGWSRRLREMGPSHRTLFVLGCLLVAVTLESVHASGDCYFPFIYNGIEHNYCTDEQWYEPWCSTTKNFDADQQWIPCPEGVQVGAKADTPGYPVIYTLEGNRCYFPFVAFSRTFTNCTDFNEATGKPWCSLTADYTTDELFGYCDFTKTAGCDYEFTLVPNTLAYDGVQQSGVNTVADCKMACQGDPTCVSFDFNQQNLCFLHSDANKATYSTTGVDHYIRNPCTTTSAAPTTATQGVTVTGTTAPCEVTFSKVDGVLSQGGIQQPGVFNETECQILCENSLTMCYGFDMSVLGCFLHLNSTVFAIKMSAPGVTQYTREDCVTTTTSGTTGACVDTFTEYNNTLSYNGVLVPSVLDVAGCKAACIADPTCLAFDFDSISTASKCFLHSDASYIQNQNTNANGVTQYLRVPCTPIVETTTKPSQTTRVPPTVTVRPTSPGVTETTAPVTTTTPCVETFNEFLSQLSYGGVLDPLAKTVADCQAACLANAACMGVDYDVAHSECFIHADAALFASIVSTTGVNQYQRVRCDGVTTPPTPVQTTKPTSPLPVDCTKRFMLIGENQHALGGVMMDSMQTLQGCQAACIAVDSCVAIDYNNGSQSCWLLHDAAQAASLTPLAGVNNYRVFIDCLSTTTVSTDCINTLIVTENAHLLGGVALVPPTSKDACEAACRSNSSCYGFDHNNGTSSCWLHVDPAMAATQESLQGVNYYKLDKQCSTATTTEAAPDQTTTTAGCVQTFTQTSDHHALGGVYSPTGDSLQKCQLECLSNASCKGFDYNNGTKGCWLISDAAALDKLEGLAGVDNYRLVTDCTGAPTTTAPCVDSFTPTLNMHANGGTQQTGVTTLDACKQNCLSNLNCVGFDWNNGSSQCWTHESAALIVQLSPLDNVDNYLLQRCGAAVITTTPHTTTTGTPGIDPTEPCVESFIVSENMHGSGGVLNPAAKTLADCQTACRLMVGCVGVDYDASSAGCWTHDQLANVQTLAPLNGVNNYRLTSNCAGITTTVPPVSCLADVSFLIDRSGSIRDQNVAGRQDNYLFILEFLSKLVSRLPVGQDQTRVSAVTFSNYAQVAFPLDMYDSSADVQNKILSLSYAGGKTNMTGAFKLANEEVFVPENGDRLDKVNVIILVTDGNNTIDVDTLDTEVQKLKDKGVIIYGIGVTKAINEDEMKRIVTNPDTHFFPVDDFNMLNPILEQLVISACAGTVVI